MKKYFEVVAKCGHVGRNSYIEIPFPVVAADIHEATQIARRIPRVKHHRKDAISSAREITEEQYRQLQQSNDRNPYLKCTSIQQQRACQNEIESLIKNDKTPESTKRTKRDSVGFRRQREREYLKSLILENVFLLDALPAALC